MLESTSELLDFSMKRWIFWSFISAATFLAGIAFVLAITLLRSPDPKAGRHEPDTLVQEMPTPSIPELEVIDEVSYTFDDTRSSTRLLELGEGFHGDEIPAKNGDEWLGLFKQNEKYVLKPVKLDIKLVHDPIFDDDENIRTGKSVHIRGSNRPLFMLNGIKAVRPGKALTFYRGPTDHDLDILLDRDIEAPNVFTTLDKDYSGSFSAAENRKYELRVIKAKNRDGQRILALSLESSDVRQILHTVRTWDEDLTSNAPEWSGTLGTLYWAGDIDRDGKPDLYMELSAHENLVWKALFLSSTAEAGKHVKLAAEFLITGC